MDSVVQALLYEERLLQNRLQRLESECVSRPKGSVVIKLRHNTKYAYLQWREGPRVRSRYLGKADSWQCRSMQAKIIERQRYKAEAKETRRKLEKIKHLLEEASKFS
jgi:hypothetical protein